jgi:hypothetical protein
MKRVGNLISQIASLDNLYLAFVKASVGKQRKREVLQFREHFDDNIYQLQQSILNESTEIGHYHFFIIHDPKKRTICAASFHERILHHAIMNVCHEFFERDLIFDTYASRPGKGVYQALSKAAKAASHYDNMVKLDFRKYFDSVCHDKLKHLLQRKFKDAVLLRLFNKIIDSYCTECGRGLPIGNLTSQYFANAYLSGFDHMAKEQLRLPVYIRYMDDILIAADDRQILKAAVEKLKEYASDKLCLELKPPVFCNSKDGLSFLGYRVLPYHYLMCGQGKRRFRSKMITYENKLSNGIWDDSKYTEHLLPLLAFVKHADSWKFRRSCIESISGDRQRVGRTV